MRCDAEVQCIPFMEKPSGIVFASVSANDIWLWEKYDSNLLGATCQLDDAVAVMVVRVFFNGPEAVLANCCRAGAAADDVGPAIILYK